MKQDMKKSASVGPRGRLALGAALMALLLAGCGQKGPLKLPPAPAQPASAAASAPAR